MFSNLALKKASDGDHSALGALLALWLGMRSGEISRLKVRDVDYTDEESMLLWIEGDVKTESSKRRLEVPEPLIAPLLEVAGKRDREEILFEAYSSDGKHSKTWLRKAVASLCKKAGVPKVCPHGLRGTHATLAEDAGSSAHVVAASLGHEKHKTTEEHYLEKGTKERAMARRFLKVVNGGLQNQKSGGPEK